VALCLAFLLWVQGVGGSQLIWCSIEHPKFVKYKDKIANFHNASLIRRIANSDQDMHIITAGFYGVPSPKHRLGSG
jgi:hypothetical protein